MFGETTAQSRCQTWCSSKATNAIFGKIGRIASEEVILQLINCKCMPIYYMD